ncbi:MAG: RidA family protein [Xanthobacteraceae bacterium]|uniref:RidA family protein n=1 Tax=Pseudolabrys sp. TaxID=1960880 RepID=UPI003D0C2359
MANKFLNPKTMAPPPGYTYVVDTMGPARTIYIAGQLGLDIENRLVGAPGDFAAQAEQAFVNLKFALAAVGATMNDVVKINNYLVDMTHMPLFREVRDRHVNVKSPPASTTVGISQLARPGALFEIEAIAVVPARAAAAASSSASRRSSKAKSAKAKSGKKAAKKSGKKKR